MSWLESEASWIAVESHTKLRVPPKNQGLLKEKFNVLW